MADKKPLKAIFTEAGNVDSLGEFEDADFIGVDNGGTGAVTLTQDEVLLGNGTSAVASVVRGNLIAGSNKLTINNGSTVSGVVLGQNVTIDIDETKINLQNTTGQISLADLLLLDPDLAGSDYGVLGASISGDVPLPDAQGNVTYNGGTWQDGG